MSEWFSVKENPPKKGGRYLVYEEKEEHMHNAAAFNYPYPCCEVNVAYFNHYCDGWQWSSFETGETGKCTPTHWMHQPEIPAKRNLIARGLSMNGNKDLSTEELKQCSYIVMELSSFFLDASADPEMSPHAMKEAMAYLTARVARGCSLNKHDFLVLMERAYVNLPDFEEECREGEMAIRELRGIESAPGQEEGILIEEVYGR